MIELTPKGLINQSSVMLCISNFLCSKIFICNVDIKTRSRDIKFTISTTSRPTCMYQINEDFLLVGTESGKLELYKTGVSEDPVLKRTIDAHPGSSYGITVMMPLVDPSELITNERTASVPEGVSESNFIVTAAGD